MSLMNLRRISAGIDISKQWTGNHFFKKRKVFGRIPLGFGSLNLLQGILLNGQQRLYYLLPNFDRGLARLFVFHKGFHSCELQNQLLRQLEFLMNLCPKSTKLRILRHIGGKLEKGFGHAHHTVGNQRPEKTRILIELDRTVKFIRRF